MKKVKLICLAVSVAMLCCACGSEKSFNKSEGRPESISESTEEASSAVTSETEESDSEASIADSEAENVKEDDFNDYVEVDYTPAEQREAISDENPDYSGLYYDTFGTSIPYSHCILTKKPDGTYFCDISIYRAFSLESTAVYKEDGVLEIETDDNGNSGIITIEDGVAKVTINYATGETEEIGEFIYMYSTYPDLSGFEGTYTYTQEDGTDVTIEVYYDERLEAHIDVTVGDEYPCRFFHYPPSASIYVIDGMLIAERNEMFTGPDDEYEFFIENYDGNSYIIIDNTGDTSKVYYKYMEPVVMH